MGRLNDLMNFYKLSSQENIPINAEKFQLNDLIQEIKDAVDILAKMKHIKFEIKNKSNSIDLTINSDRQKLLSILINLLTNSLKYAPNGEITLEISLKNENILSYKVSDNGCGISKENTLKIKSDTFDIGILTNDNTKGIGLGLYLSGQILSYLGPCNTFKIESEINKGTKFSFQIFLDVSKKSNLDDLNQKKIKNYKKISNYNSGSLNLLSETDIHLTLDHEFQPKPNNLNVIARNSFIDYQILIVDDQPFNIYVLKMQLLKIKPNYQICEAYDGKQAIELFQQFNHIKSNSQIKLIFMDCQMPIMNGFDATQYIKSKCKEQNYFPVNIVGYTSLLTTSEKHKCQVCGMNFWLQKPANFTQIREIIQKYYEEINDQ